MKAERLLLGAFSAAFFAKCMILFYQEDLCFHFTEYMCLCFFFAVNNSFYCENFGISGIVNASIVRKIAFFWINPTAKIYADPDDFLFSNRIVVIITYFIGM